MSSESLGILHIDTECRPGHWIVGDYVSQILTAVAWSWRDSDEVVVLTHYDRPPSELAFELYAAIKEADIVTGHYIRGHDLPLLNGELLRNNFGPMNPVMTVDTKLDVAITRGRSLSQKNLASSLWLGEEKVDVTLSEWEGFNSKDEHYREVGEDRVRQDVVQHKALYDVLLDYGWLRGPKVWRPNAQGDGRYRP